MYNHIHQSLIEQVMNTTVFAAKDEALKLSTTESLSKFQLWMVATISMVSLATNRASLTPRASNWSLTWSLTPASLPAPMSVYT
jgi:hypothetical protein